MMSKDTVLALARHAGTFVGGMLAMAGFIDEGVATELTAAFVTVASIAWSLYEKKARAAQR